MVRLRHYDGLNTARFITVTCHRRLHLLRQNADIEIVLNEIDAARIKFGFLIFAYVIMPNHFHLVLYPRKPIKLGSAIGEIKSRSARTILARWRESSEHDLGELQVVRNGESRLVFWQQRCYDHNCRTIESMREKIDYCHKNPVRAELVAEPGDWPWSSFRHYYGGEDVPIVVNDIPF